MQLGTARCRAAVGVEAPAVDIEVHVGAGLPRFTIIGMPETAVRESRDRVRSALIHAGFRFPDGATTVHLAPADLPKQGGRYDLAIAIGVLAASDQIPKSATKGVEFYGELSLAGELRSAPGLLPAAIAAAEAGACVIVPSASAEELALVDSLELFGGATLAAVAAHLNGCQLLENATRTEPVCQAPYALDFAEVVGQAHARRALEIAAAGGHNVLMMGPPGSGKSMLAERFPGILPPLDRDCALATAALKSVLGESLSGDQFFMRPFRAPHHTASAVALVGGQSPPRPGEVSRAHNGVLFLDEIAEFPRHVLDVLREPLEAGHIVISRAGRQATFPARFQLIAAMNPCPCGYSGDPDILCRCTPDQIARYRGRLSGPLLDRIDCHLSVGRVPISELTHAVPSEATSEMAARVAKARELALARQGVLNAQLGNALKSPHCALDEKAIGLLHRAAAEFHLSARGVTRAVRMARTIADLAVSDRIDKSHAAEALSLRAAQA